MKTELYPLTFQPILKEKIWGGQKLYNKFNKGENADAKVGESWEIADLEEGQSIVNDGDLKGKSLKELINQNPQGLLGKKVYDRFGKQFPLLIKFIDASKDLSIQVHPSDETSPTGVGKTEMWYIMQADEGAKITVGFKPGMSREVFEKHIENNTVEKAMDMHKVSHGDSFFINAGRIHAIGSGVLLAEIQQTSDVTYRVYDYNRKDDNGELRELHIEASKDVLEYNDTQDFKLEYPRNSNKAQTLKHHDYFKTDWMHLEEQTYTIDRSDSFTIIMVVSGTLEYRFDTGKSTLKAGQTVLIPAQYGKVLLEAKDCELLEVYL
ncbi:MAG TPA: mannose-6-phosphate isomerase [Leeuwenhoekiella sp.]|nr:mannose-6-phosphate isomerase [Leeuwenhoekiella sp.]